MAFLPAHLSVGVTEDESNRREEVTFAGSIATDDNIRLGREGLDNGLVFVAGECISNGAPNVLDL